MMFKRVAFLLLSVFVATSPVSAVPPTLPKFPPLEFNPPKPERYTLPNGLTVFLLEDHELPIIHVQMLIGAGSQYDPAEVVGQSAILGPAMTQGGSQKFTPEQIERLLDTTGAHISFSVGLEEATGGLNVRASDFDKLFEVFTDLLLAPQFRRDFVNLEKDKAQEALRRMNDEPTEIGRREFRKVIYGKAHPYARTPDPRTIDRISRKGLLEMHQRYFKPNGSMIALSGDFKSADMKKKIEAALGSWQKADVAYPIVPPVVPTAQKSLYYVQRPLDQSQIRIGHTGFARHNPDHFAWEVFNELWGGGATSRLFRIVRTEKGLAYAVASVFTEPKDLGMIAAISQTRGPETPLALQAILDITQEVRSIPFTETEIRTAKEAIQNRFIENFASSSQIVGETMLLEFHGFPKDYLDTYTDKVSKVTVDDLRKAAQKNLHPDKLAILVVGDLSTFNKPLSTFGRPREIRLPDYQLQSQQP